MRPYIICHMITSIDGGLHPESWTASPDGDESTWSTTYEDVHEKLDARAWLVGRVTMAEISKVGRRLSSTLPAPAPERPVHVADSTATRYAIALDQHGRLHFDQGDLDGDHVVVLLGKSVSDSHLSELAADGVSYVVSDGAEMDLQQAMATLRQVFQIDRLLLEGGAGINGSFFAAGLVDELSVVLAPALDARKGSDRIVEFGEFGLRGKCELSFQSVDHLGSGTLHLRYRVAQQAQPAREACS